eukprot:TRINITY_DN3126_c0_g1_i6.p1 TRINITY_DN3126_c0_g1~~TRINITY_DN3126_c0_g1_i6.p1  ORF type:complete len:1516 (+),score=323.93 TRINITY_DN3126_c0_g1_i6:167-4549(+)
MYPCKYAGMEVVGDGYPAVTGLEMFAEQVFDDLWGYIDKNYLPELPPDDPLELERSYHQAFAQQQTDSFVGRKEILSRMTKFVEGFNTQLLVISGSPGDGKSSLLANFACDYALKNPRTFVLPHFISSSPGSIDICNTLRRLCNELKQAFKLEEKVPEEYKELTLVFSSMLESASFKGKVVVIIDALNQLDPSIERSHLLEWLPSKLPCKFIVSTLSGKVLDSLRGSRFQNTVMEIPIPPLEMNERADLVRTILLKYHKKLDEKAMNNQMRILQKKPHAGNPLYLAVACEELRVFGIYERVSDKIKNMAGTLPRLFEEVLRRLETDHGHDLVQNTCSLILCSRNGLLEKELIGLLQTTENKWAALQRNLAAFIKPTGDSGEITFFHESFSQAVKARYLSQGRSHLKYEAILGDYFYRVLDPNRNGQWQGCSNIRAVSELPHHLVAAEKWTEVGLVLCDLGFIELKAMHGLTYGLLADYNEATRPGLKYAKLTQVREFGDFVKASVHVLTRNPTLVFQQASNRPSFTSPAKVAKEMWDSLQVNQSWIEWTNKPEESDPCKMTFSGFTDGITACTYSLETNLIACATRDCVIHVYDNETGSELSTMAGHSNWIPSLKFSGDGSVLASGSWDSVIILWDVKEAKEITRFTEHERRVNDVAFSSTTTYLASASWDTTVRIWKTNGETSSKYTFYCGERPLNSVAWGPEDKKLVVGVWDGTIRVINMDYEQEGQMLAVLSGHKKSILSLAYSPSGKHLVSGSMDQELFLWDAQAGKFISSLSKHCGPVSSVAYTFDGSNLLSASTDGTIKIWEANLGTEKGVYKLECGWMNCCSFDPTNPCVLAMGSSECHVEVWDVSSWLQVFSIVYHARPVTCIEFSPDGHWIVSGSEDGSAALWDATQEFTLAFELQGHTACITGISWSPNSEEFATSSDDYTINIWEVGTGKIIRTLKGHDSAVRSVSFDPQGKMIVSASRDNTLRIWDSRNGRQVATLKGHTDWITSCSYNPSGKRIVSCGWDNTVRLWNPKKTEPIATMEGHDSSVACAKFTRDGKNIVSCGYDNKIKIWDAESATELTTLSGHTSRVNGITQNSDNLIASVSDDATIRLWDPLSATEVQTLVGHSGAVRSASFHSTRKTIISGSDDRSMKVWDIGLQKEEAGGWGSWGSKEVVEKKETVITHSGCINHVSLSRSATWLLSASDDKKCFLWDVGNLKHIRTFRNSGTSFKCCSFASDENTFLTATDDGEIILWDQRVARKGDVLYTHDGPATSCTFHPSSQKVLSGGWDNKVVLTDLRKATSEVLVGGHRDWVLSTVYSPSGEHMASAGWDQEILVWYGGNKTGHALFGHVNTITSLAISPDSRWLASGSYDSTVKIWNLLGKKQELTLPGHDGHVNKICFAPTLPSMLFSAGQDGVVKIWDLSSRALVNEFVCTGPATACDVALRGSEKVMVFGDSIGHFYVGKSHGR